MTRKNPRTLHFHLPSRALATVVAVAALASAAVGCGGGDQATSGSTPRGSTTTQRMDTRQGGTPNEHVDKPGESK